MGHLHSPDTIHLISHIHDLIKTFFKITTNVKRFKCAINIVNLVNLFLIYCAMNLET